jgi:autotransporter-associated beta strand protein
LGSPLSGGGTLNLVVNYVRDSLDGDWSAFTGLVNVTGKNASGDEFRINNKFGYTNAAIFLNDGVIMDRASGANPTNDIGELGGTSLAIVGPGNSSSGSPTWRVGWKNTTATFGGTIANDGTTSIIKVGSGTWYLSGQNTFAGSTTISTGVLALTNGVNGDGSIGNSTNIFISAGAFLDVIGRSDGAMPLNYGQVISGNGVLRGILNTAGGGTVSPGGGIAGSVGTLTVTNTINLGGTAWMKLNRATSPNSDRLVSSTASIISYGGTLVVTNIGAPLQVGDTFTLFSAGTLNNAFTLALPNYYTWNTSQLAVNGQISVTGKSQPAITNVDFSQLSSGTITINANNGAPNGPVNVLTSTNLTLPLASWTTVTSTTFDGNGNLNLPITVDPALPQSFYLLQVY